MENNNLPTRRKFIAIGATSAAALLGLNVTKSAASTLPPNALLPNTLPQGTTNPDVANTSKVFNNVLAMQQATSLKTGDVVSTLGYHQAGDAGDNSYSIVSTGEKADGGSLIALQNGLQAKAVFPGGEIRIEQFGAIGVDDSQNNTANAFDNTQAMQHAHRLGKTITYGAKTYYFSSISIARGGIAGQGEHTVLVSFDESNNNAISFSGSADTYSQQQSTEFKHFVLKTLHRQQKAEGAGVRFNLEESLKQYTVVVQNVKIEHFPTSIHTHPLATFSIRDSVFSDYSQQGLYVADSMPGDKANTIHGNMFQTTANDACGITVQGGNVNISNNTIVGGNTGVTLTPALGCAVNIDHNNIKQQTFANVYLTGSNYINSHTNHQQTSQFIISQNQLNAMHPHSSAIHIATNNTYPENVSVNNNLISYSGGDKSVAAIQLHNANGFMINNNTINCNNGEGNWGLYIGEDSNNGVLSANHVIVPQHGHTLNKSITTTEV